MARRDAESKSPQGAHAALAALERQVEPTHEQLVIDFKAPLGTKDAKDAAGRRADKPPRQLSELAARFQGMAVGQTLFIAGVGDRKHQVSIGSTAYNAARKGAMRFTTHQVRGRGIQVTRVA